jgi:hypothetical protein
LVGQFPDVVRLKVTTQANRGLPALRSLFDLHVPNHLDRRQGYCMRCANAKLGGFTGFWLQETAELSGILIFRKKV